MPQNMDDSLFSELLDSVREGGTILRGEKEASRAFTLESPDVSSPNPKKGDKVTAVTPQFNDSPN